MENHLPTVLHGNNGREYFVQSWHCSPDPLDPQIVEIRPSGRKMPDPTDLYENLDRACEKIALARTEHGSSVAVRWMLELLYQMCANIRNFREAETQADKEFALYAAKVRRRNRGK